MHVALYGGAFNPIRTGHILIALQAQLEHQFDAVWFVPTWENAFGKQLASFEDRLAMCRLATKELSQTVFAVKDFERKWKTRYSIDLIVRLYEQYPGYRWSFIMGADQYDKRESWHRWQELECLINPVVIPNQPGRSTEVRQRIEQGDWGEVSKMVPKQVGHYLQRNGLYGKV